MEKSILINESGLSLKDGRDMVLKIIDSQINNYKLQYLTDWERNHKTKPTRKNKKIAQLEALRDEIINTVNYTEDEEDGALNFSLSLNVNVVKNKNATVDQHEFVA